MIKEVKTVDSFCDDILSDLDAFGLSELIRSKKVKTKEVIEATINRAKSVNPKINAIVTDCYDYSLKNLNRSLGFFSGVPIFFKDMTAVKGIPNYFGSDALLNAKPATKTDPIVKQILGQGFINLGTTSMSEFGFTCSTEFPNQPATRNPWNLDHTVGGSSGGSAALVSAGVVPIAHAADGGGSIRIPASCCGLVGLKPSRGRLLKSGPFKHQPVEIATDGILSRTVRDTAYFYAEAEKYYKNQKLPRIGLVKGPSNKKYKIGFCNESVMGLKADETVTESLNSTANLLESIGHDVKSIKLPIEDQFLDDFINLWSMLAFYSKNLGKVSIDSSFSSDRLADFTKGLSKNHLKNILLTPFFINRLKKSYYDYQMYLEKLNIDFILTPTVSHLTPEIGYLGMDIDFDTFLNRMIKWVCFTPYSNACGSPSISLPLGHDNSKNLPIGMMFWANNGQERLLLDIAYQLEEAKPWKKIN